jgi:hypothetical protein
MDRLLGWGLVDTWRHANPIGRLFHPADVVIDAGFDAALSQRRACQQQVDTQTAIVIETFRAVIEP